jgi:aspartyl-tRNA(Asn)/glutamyl-tRNA(Gln) amidotransferase subunit A
VSIFLARPASVGEGVRLAVKDLFDTAGLRTTYGSAVFADHVPDRTAEAVARLEAKGYANVGKTNLHEFAYGITGDNEHYGPVPNPLDPSRVSGGSSSGSAAALAAGLADAALGTDSGGSIRIPAACCGVVGFKPTFGLVPMDGCFPLAPSFDHAGPMGPDVETCVRMTEALVPGFEAAAPVPLADLALGVAWVDLADPLVRAQVQAVAERFPRHRAVDFPLGDGIAHLFMHEVAQSHRELFPARAAEYGENVRTKLGRCAQVSDAQVEDARRRREELSERAFAALEGLDLLITPTLGFVAPRRGPDELALRESVIRFTFPFNALGWPALALPCGPAEDGMPASAQLIGRPGDDARVLAVGATLSERRLPRARR